jgi:hypothetical protein
VGQAALKGFNAPIGVEDMRRMTDVSLDGVGKISSSTTRKELIASALIDFPAFGRVKARKAAGSAS